MAGQTLTSVEVDTVAIIASVSIAFIGYVVTYLNETRRKRLDAQYEFVTAQLRDLYGPLFALTRANSRTWIAFRSGFRPGRQLFSANDPMSPEEVKTWAYWITHVFQPSNRKMKAIIEGNAHLFAQQELPKPILDFLAHTDMFEIVVANWQSNDYSILFTPLQYPPGLDTYVQHEYRSVSAEHARLSGRRIGAATSPTPAGAGAPTQSNPAVAPGTS